MFRAIRRDARTIIIAVVAASLTAGAPAIAHGVHAAFAHNADKVDGKHAVSSSTSLSKAKGKLVATGTNGKFAAKFLPKVDAAKNADNALKVNGLSGATLTGGYYVMGPATGVGQVIGNGISFGFRLPSIPTPHFVAAGGTAPAECPGSFVAPSAAAGHLCVYEHDHSNVGPRNVDLLTASGGGIYIQSTGAGHTYSVGSWAVKPPAAGSSAMTKGVITSGVTR